MAAVENGPSKGPCLIIPCDKYRYQAFEVTEGNVWELRHRILPIHHNFRNNPFTAPDEVERHIQTGAKVIIAKTKSHSKDVGFVAYRVHNIAVDGQNMRIANISAKVVLPLNQKEGIGTHFSKDVIEIESVGAVTGRTANPYAVAANYDTGYIESGYPHDRNYPGKIQRALIAVLSIEEDLEGIKNTDLLTGLYREAYPQNEVQLFDIDPEKHPLAHSIYEAWRSPRIGMHPENGDGIRYWLKVDKRKVPQAREQSAFTIV